MTTLKYRIKYSNEYKNACGYDGKYKTMTILWPLDGTLCRQRPGRLNLLSLAHSFLKKEGIEYYKVRSIALKKVNDAVIKNDYYVHNRIEEQRLKEIGIL